MKLTSSQHQADMNLYLITGTTQGLGAALRDVLSSDANNVVFSMSRFSASILSPSNIFVDLADIESIAPAFEQLTSRIAGRSFATAVLINNAGVVAPVAPFNDSETASLKQNLHVNLLAPMILMRLFANATRLIAPKRLIINISSGAAKRPIAGWSAYCTAKAGLEMATRVAALEASMADPLLTICSLAPGVIDTAMQGQIREKSAQEFPDVERFRAMKNEGGLRAAHDVARDIIDLIKADRLTNGGNLDIRELLKT